MTKGLGCFWKKKQKKQKTWDIVETEQRTGRVTAQLNGALGKLHIRFDRKASMLALFTMFTCFGKYKNDIEDQPWSTCCKNLSELRTEQHSRVFINVDLIESASVSSLQHRSSAVGFFCSNYWPPQLEKQRSSPDPDQNQRATNS